MVYQSINEICNKCGEVVELEKIGEDEIYLLNDRFISIKYFGKCPNCLTMITKYERHEK